MEKCNADFLLIEAEASKVLGEKLSKDIKKGIHENILKYITQIKDNLTELMINHSEQLTNAKKQ